MSYYFFIMVLLNTAYLSLNATMSKSMRAWLLWYLFYRSLLLAAETRISDAEERLKELSGLWVRATLGYDLLMSNKKEAWAIIEKARAARRVAAQKMMDCGMVYNALQISRAIFFGEYYEGENPFVAAIALKELMSLVRQKDSAYNCYLSLYARSKEAFMDSCLTRSEQLRNWKSLEAFYKAKVEALSKVKHPSKSDERRKAVYFKSKREYTALLNYCRSLDDMVYKAFVRFKDAEEMTIKAAKVAEMAIYKVRDPRMKVVAAYVERIMRS